jgi:hypothetical protein
VTTRVALALVPREPPLAVAAVLARGTAVVAALAARLLRSASSDATGTCSSSGDVLIVVGPSLPWVDGVVYLGREPSCPQLLVPTTRATSLPADLVWAAFAQRGARGPLALLDGLVNGPPRALSLAAASALDESTLRRLAGVP